MLFAEEALLVLMLVGRLAIEALVAFQVGEADREGAFQMAWMDLISLNTPTWLGNISRRRPITPVLEIANRSNHGWGAKTDF